MKAVTIPRISLKNVLLGAIGGQGGNVLVEWLFLAAQNDGRRAQALSLPGLSQRGGGTTFYLEIASLENPTGNPALDQEALEKAVFAQFPFPGRVDVLVGQELVELGRLVQGGFASRRTTIVASSQRLYTIDEKTPAFDGIFPSEKIIRAAASLAGSISVIDTSELARQHNLGDLATNAILLGALSAVAGALPMPVDRYREAIREFKLAVELNLQAFEVGRQYQLNFNREFQQIEESLDQPAREDKPRPGAKLSLANTIPFPGNKPAGEGAADSGDPENIKKIGPVNPPVKKEGKPRRSINLTPIQKKSGTKPPALTPVELLGQKAALLPPAVRAGYQRLGKQVLEEWPEPLQPLLVEALFQLSEYQNAAYAARLLELLRPVLALEPPDKGYELTQVYARTLAMRLTYEDAVRVAALKIKPGRLERISREMGVKPGQLLEVTDYLKPDMAEIYGIMPAVLVGPMLALGKISGLGYYLGKKHFTLPQQPRVTSLKGFLTFRFLTLFKPLRLASYRFKEEWKLLQEFNRQVLDYARYNYELGVLVAESGKMVKGYGDTRRKMIKTMDRFYTAILAPLFQAEIQAQKALNPPVGPVGIKAGEIKAGEIEAGEIEAGEIEAEPFGVTLKTARAALQLIGRSDEGPVQAEALTREVLGKASSALPRGNRRGR